MNITLKQLNTNALNEKKQKNVLLRHIQRIMYNDGQITKYSNLNTCGRVPIAGVVEFGYSASTKVSYIGGVANCHNTWLCPVCSSKIAKVRHDEVEKGIRSFHSSSSANSCVMLTLTFSHKKSDRLSDLLSSFSQASATFWRLSGVQRIMGYLGVSGKISAFEIMASRQNGWHPHKHVLMFCNRASLCSAYQSSLLEYWQLSLLKHGLVGNEHALKLDSFKADCKYLTKLSSEMTLSHIKRGRGLLSHYAPFQLAELSRQSDVWARTMFLEYARCIKGRSQLHWSKGLKLKLGVVELSDSEICDVPPVDKVVGFRIVSEDFKRLIVPYDYRPELLHLLSLGDYGSISAILKRCSIRLAFGGGTLIESLGYYSRVAPDLYPESNFDLDKYRRYTQPFISYEDWRSIWADFGRKATFINPEYYANCKSR